jgi:nucleotidyltransferase substrate binding protein (TIGR01987 family)
MEPAMNLSDDTRWKQRFQNLEKAFSTLEKALSKNSISELERAGLIKIYELTFELAWKTLKDYLEDKAIPVKYPRETIKKAFSYELIEDGELWLEMLGNRNLMVHAYDEARAKLAQQLISDKYYQALKQVIEKLRVEDE